MAEKINREELVKGEQMDKALAQAAEIKREILTTHKERDKNNFEQFFATCVHADSEIQEILGKKKKKRTDEEEARLKQFKKDTARSYKMVCDLLLPEEAEDGKPTKFEKIVDKVALVLDYLRYIGANDLENEFNRRGITLATGLRLEDKSSVWADEAVKKNICDIFDAGKRIREATKAENEKIVEGIFVTDVPQELVYEKETNPVGLKKSDWAKLVDFKTKLLMAASQDQKEKIEDQASDLAGEKQFDIERAKIMQAKLTALESEAEEKA